MEEVKAQEEAKPEIVFPEMVPVKSSQLEAVGYDEAASQLFVRFKGGSLYRYDTVEKEKYDGLMAADSKGRYFGQIIKADPQKYPFTKIVGVSQGAKREPIQNNS